MDRSSKRSRDRHTGRERNREEEVRERKRGRNHDEKGRGKSKDVETVDRDFKERRRERCPRDQDHENRDRDRDGERDSDRKRIGNRDGRERYPERERNREEEVGVSKRCRNYSERHHDEKGREKSTDVETVQDHENRGYRDEKEDKVEPVVHPEQAQRIVFAYQISEKAVLKDLFQFFSRRAGHVRDVKLIMDRNTRGSKRIGCIEFTDVMSVPRAIAMSGQLLLGHPVTVKPFEAEKNLVQSTTAVSEGLVGAYRRARRIYVGNLPITIKEAQLCYVFESFGHVELVQMPVDQKTGNCKGYAFIQFGRHDEAQTAVQSNEQLQIAGRVIKVSAEWSGGI